MVNTAKLYMLKLVPKLKIGNGKDGKKKKKEKNLIFIMCPSMTISHVI